MKRRHIWWLKLAAGYAVILLAIWGGAWLLADISRVDWLHLPIALTAFLVGVCGVIFNLLTLWEGP